MWIPKEDIKKLGFSEATIYRKERRENWRSRRAAASGKGQPSKEYELDSLPDYLQELWHQREEEKRAAEAEIL